MPAIVAGMTVVQIWMTVITYAIAIASAVENARKARSMKRQAIRDYNASLEDRLVMAATANGPRSRCYGRVRNVDGVIFKGTWGATSEMYTLVVALAGHEIDGIETIYFNDVPLTLQSDGLPLSDGRLGYWVTNRPIMQGHVVSATAVLTVSGGTGSVTLPHLPIPSSVGATRFAGDIPDYAVPGISGSVISVGGPDGDWIVSYQYIVESPRARVWKYLGTDTQDMSILLASRFPAIISATDKFAGVAALVVELQYDVDAWPAGVPSVSAVIRGAKVYDPRTAVTAWTENPALIARDWALYANGGGCELEHITESQFTAAANACDVLTHFDTVDGLDSRALYQCGIVCRLDGNADDAFDEMIESMAGKWGWGGGKLTVVAGMYRAPVAAITDDWLSSVEDIVVVKDPPRTDIVNVYRPVIANAEDYIDGVDPDLSTATTYTVTPMPEVRSTAFIAADGQELAREITFGGVTRNSQAQHICGVMMRDARDGLILKLPCNLRAWQLELFDVVTVTLPFFGFDAKLFEILGWKYSVDNGVILTLKETAASIYDPDSGLGVLNAAVNSTLPLPWDVPTITGLEVESGTVDLEDGTQQTRVLVTWDAIDSEAVLQSGKIEVQYSEFSVTGLPDGDWPSTLQEGGATSATIQGLRAGEAYLFRARAINTLGVRGAWAIQVLHAISIPPEVATAEEAAANAATALAAIADIVSDNLLTPDEKPRVILDNSVILAEQSGIDAQATAFGVTTEKTTYDTAVSDLTTYLATLTTPVLWSSLAGNTAIVGATFSSKFADVYGSRQALLNKIYNRAKVLADAAQSAATAAAGDATAALAALADIASDNLLSPGEKPVVILDNAVILAEQAGIDAKATAQAITTEKTTYDTAVSALTTYLATLTTPVLWSNLAGNTTIVGTTFRTKFADVYAARQALLNLIAVKIADGAVGTPQLDSEAATTTMTSESASGSLIGTNVPITSVSWTNTTGSAVTVQAEYSIEAMVVGGSLGGGVVYVMDIITGISAAYTSPNISSTEVAYSKVIQRSVPNLATVTVRMDGYSPFTPPTASLDWRRAVVRLTAIKK